MPDWGIAEKAALCQQALRGFLVAVKEGESSGVLSPREVDDLHDRFDQWAGNLGALQPASSTLSLEHRLQNSPTVGETVSRLLVDLLESLRLATDIATGRRRNRTADTLVDSDIDLDEYGLSLNDSDEDTDTDSVTSLAMSSNGRMNTAGPVSEIDELMSAVRSSIDRLFRISIFIRNHAPPGKRQRALEKGSFDNRADVMYIQDKYPLMANTHPFLTARLGQANANRRQYFKYCRDHNDNLSGKDTTTGRDTVSEQAPHAHLAVPEPAGTSGDGPARSILSGHTKPSILAQTEATEFIAPPFENMGLLEHLDAEPARSVVSFATTVAETADDSLGFPPLPAEAERNTTFLCPYCFTVIAIKGTNKRRQWRFVRTCYS